MLQAERLQLMKAFLNDKQEYYVFIQDQENSACTQDFRGTVDCSEGGNLDCDLLISTTTECIDENSFNVVLNVSGSDSYTVTSSLGSVTGFTEGEMTLGPFTGDSYKVTVTSEDTENCEKRSYGICRLQRYARSL